MPSLSLFLPSSGALDLRLLVGEITGRPWQENGGWEERVEVLTSSERRLLYGSGPPLCAVPGCVCARLLWHSLSLLQWHLEPDGGQTFSLLLDCVLYLSSVVPLTLPMFLQIFPSWGPLQFPPFGVPYVFRALLVTGNHAFGSDSKLKAKIKCRGPSVTS